METAKQVKSGIKTSEFWITLLTCIGAGTGQAAGAFQGDLSWVGFAMMALSGAAYAISRGLAKK